MVSAAIEASCVGSETLRIITQAQRSCPASRPSLCETLEKAPSLRPQFQPTKLKRFLLAHTHRTQTNMGRRESCYMIKDRFEAPF